MPFVRCGGRAVSSRLLWEVGDAHHAVLVLDDTQEGAVEQRCEGSGRVVGPQCVLSAPLHPTSPLHMASE